ncbi:dihydroorotate dehydrogenase [Phaeovulum sp. W22_SRMD_FR3]|uniref:dihydroorotate dehydrogenase n=1 Tax=Phaeovulum sp. W22_SRMD_FR3 TaxID=3240274 RepID=UPI003F9E9522
MAETDREFDGLEGYFAAARATAMDPSADFMARVLADAEAEAARRIPQGLSRPQAAPRQGLWAMLVAGLGGWGGLGGMATAAVAGVWIGVSGLSSFGTVGTTLSGSLWSASTVAEQLGSVQLLPDDDILAWADGQEG